MADSVPELIQLDILNCPNWLPGAAPVAVLNRASGQRDRAAYCWGLASQIHEIAGFIAESENSEVQRAGSLLQNHLAPLVAVLQSMTYPTEQDGVES